MKIGLVGNNNGKGLQVDAELLGEFLKAEGHEVETIQFDQPYDGKCEVGIFLEVVESHLFQNFKRLWWFPNLEWTKPSYLKPAEQFEYIFAKTHDAERVLKEHFSTVHYTGFLTRDKMDASVPRERKFLHIGGGSGFKNTNAVISAWREYRYWNGLDAPDAPLTVISNSNTVNFEETPGMTFIKRASDEEIRRLQNSHLFHLYPSAYEGWGHALHEAFSVGAITLSTDSAPMSEFGCPHGVPPIVHQKRNLATIYEVSGKDIRESIPWMLKEEPILEGRISRNKFEKNNSDFKEAFRPFLAESVSAWSKILSDPKNVKTIKSFICGHKPTIALLGNFQPPHSTENDLKWTLGDMGYPVVTFQENEATTEEILKGCRDVSLLIYVHTHSWVTPGKMSLDDLWAELRAKRIKTCSFHLDRYWGLNALDQREDLIGKHPFWHTERVFTADGGSHDWATRGVWHCWLPPAVVKRDCYLGTAREDLKCDVGFVGATGYHPEYLFRGELIAFLKETYGERFRIFQGYRGPILNDLYQSIKVVVGDSCFAGSDNYFSDRVTETLGRGGFIIHPQTKGLQIPGLVTFTPGNLLELRDKIDYFVDADGSRGHLQLAGQLWVKDHETYSNRMAALLSVMEIA